MFGAGLAGSLTYLIGKNDPQLQAVWTNFITLSVETRFCLSLLLVSVVYFGGAMYVATAEEEQGFLKNAPVVGDAANKDEVDSVTNWSTPASCDKDVTFEVPAVISEDDTTLFNDIFTK